MDEVRKTHNDIERLLKDFGQETVDFHEEIIYGVYDSRNQPFWERLNNFFIDRSKVSRKDKSYFYHLMAVMVDAGLSVTETLKILARRSTNERFRRVLNTIAHEVEKGKALSKAMDNFPTIFNESEVAIVQSGEAIGHLDKMLFRLSDQTERMYEISLKITTALVYPVVVIISLIVAGVILMLFVVPKLAQIFASSKAKLPFITQVFISASSYFGTLWWIFIIIVLILFIAFRLYQSDPKGKLKIDYYTLKIPIIGELIRKMLIARFVNMLEIMVSAGLSISKILEIIALSIGNDVYKLKILQVRDRVVAGEKISTNLADAPFLFPETVTSMLRIGEQSASLDKSADKLAKHFETEVDHSIKRMTAVFEPIVIVLIALVIAVVAWAVLGPIFSLSELV